MQTRTHNLKNKTRAAAKAKADAKSEARAGKKPDAVALLRADHEAVDKLFKQYESRKDKMNADEKRALTENICMELTAHTIIEEEIFYPQVREAVKDSDEMLDEAEVEHGSLKDRIAAIKAGDPDTGMFDANVKVLAEYVKHHVEEEHEEMFPKVKKSKLDLKELGARMADRKAQLMEGKGIQ